MRMFFASLALAAASLFSALPASAATLLMPTATASFVTSGGGAGDFLFFNEPGVITDVDVALDVSVDLALDFETANPYASAKGSLTLMDDSDFFFSGLLSSISFTTNRLSLIFTDTVANVFGDTLQLELFFATPVGADPFAGLVDGEDYSVLATGEFAPIPLPGTLPLLAGAFGLLMVRRRAAKRA